MGQYYNPVLYDANDDKAYVYDLRFEGTKLGGHRKFLEHAYLYNPICAAFNSLLIEKPVYAVWAGDYAEESDINHSLCSKNLIKINNDFEDNDKLLLKQVNNNPLLKYKYFVNHSTKEYFDLKEYINKHSGRAMNPVQMLICVGNGRGGGDYFCDDEQIMNNVGLWANCEVQLMDEIPQEYTKLYVDFYEV